MTDLTITGRRARLAGLLLLAAAGVARAQPPASEVDHATLAWLDLQRSNAAAAPAQPMLGAEAGLAYQRYLQSFTAKIPAQYGSALDQGGGGGNGGTGGTLPQN